MSSSEPFVFLTPAVQNYAWGYKGASSLAGQMWKKSQEKLTLNEGTIGESTPYAELWYGAHPSGMNVVKCKNGEVESVSHFIKNHPQFHARSAGRELGQDGNSLPYLLKVLCNDIALSIQCHPDKSTAKRLFRDHSDIYKDPNHKPEISLALSRNCEAMCGFRPWDEIAYAINNVSC